MKREVFIDTSAFYALLVKNDAAHLAMARVMAEAARSHQRFVTTDYVLDETATLLKVRGHGQLVAPFLSDVLASKSCRMAWMDSELFRFTLAYFAKHEDKEWSFTDCVSFCVMKRMGLTTALTKDHHFQVAGFLTPLLP